ncbi:hypothetical protein [Micromonospora luteifusca]|uniref:hypothetical protein n=1 Tax=Micromonospora luteifusca TaxID=709860 RepID=UPI0033B980DD
MCGVLAAAWCAWGVPSPGVPDGGGRPAAVERPDAEGRRQDDRPAHTPSILAAAFVPSFDQRLYQLLPRSDVP